MRFFTLLLLLLSSTSSQVLGCGGSDVSDMADELGSLEIILRKMIWHEDSTIEYQRFRFFGPFLERKEFLPLFSWEYLEESPEFDGKKPHISADFTPKPDDMDASKKEAQHVVDLFLAYPGSIRGVKQLPMAQAIEFLELEPTFRKYGSKVTKEFYNRASSEQYDKSDAPPELKMASHYAGANTSAAEVVNSLRAPSIALLRLSKKMSTDIPNGWSDEIRKSVTPSVWTELQALHDQWLKEYQNHPLADFVRLSSYRIPFFSSDDDIQTDQIWTILFDVFSRSPGRALWEMRYLTNFGRYPSMKLLKKQDASIIAAVLRSRAMEYTMTIEGSDWDDLWRIAEKQSDQAKGVALQESLLFLSITSLPAQPSALPIKPEVKTPFWNKMQLAALLKYNNVAGAGALADSMGVDIDQHTAELAARVYVLTRKPENALELKHLPGEQGRYIIQVGLSDEKIKETAKSGGRFAIDAAIMYGLRLSRKAGWQEAATFLKDFDAKTAKGWEQLAQLEKETTPEGRLKYAQTLANTNAFAIDSAMWRGLKSRYQRLVENKYEFVALPDERQRMEWLLLDGDMGYRSLEAYVGYLSSVPGGIEAKTQLKNANKVFNYLYNAGSWNIKEYWQLLDGSQAAKGLRQVGKTINKG